MEKAIIVVKTEKEGRDQPAVEAIADTVHDSVGGATLFEFDHRSLAGAIAGPVCWRSLRPMLRLSVLASLLLRVHRKRPAKEGAWKLDQLRDGRAPLDKMLIRKRLGAFEQLVEDHVLPAFRPTFCEFGFLSDTDKAGAQQRRMWPARTIGSSPSMISRVDLRPASISAISGK